MPAWPRIFMALPASASAQQLHTILHISKVQKRLNSPFGRTPSLLAINSTFSVSTINANPNCQKGDDDPLDEQSLLKG